MSIAQSGPAAEGFARFLPLVTDAADGQSTVSLLRRMSDDTFVPVWSHDCEEDEARMICDWMSSQPGRWQLWGRIAMRLGGEAVGPMIVDAATEAAVERADAERRAEQERLERERQSREINLFAFDPRKGRPALGLERGCDDAPFWKMRFDEKWERDRVVDYLRQQKGRFVELEAFWREQGDLELERRILSEMRDAEKRAKEMGIATGGRRPLRFWRGEA